MKLERPHATVQDSMGVWVRVLKDLLGRPQECVPASTISAQWQEAYTFRRDAEWAIALSTWMQLHQAQESKVNQLHFLASLCYRAIWIYLIQFLMPWFLFSRKEAIALSISS